MQANDAQYEYCMHTLKRLNPLQLFVPVLSQDSDVQ